MASTTIVVLDMNGKEVDRENVEDDPRDVLTDAIHAGLQGDGFERCIVCKTWCRDSVLMDSDDLEYACKSCATLEG